MATPWYLGVDCTNDSELVLSVFTQSAVKQYVKNDRTQNVLIHIDGLLQQEQLAREDLRGIVVGTGRGSFMSNRMSVTLVNGLAQSLGIPAHAVPSPFAISFAEAEALFDALSADAFALAQYASEPNIRMKP